MTVTTADYRQARQRADEERRLAKAGFVQLKSVLRPGALASRAAHKVGGAVTSAGSHVASVIQTHPVAAASVAVGAGLTLTAKPVGRFLADEFISTREDPQ